MERASECMICKDLDPKTEEYTYESESTSSSDNDDQHNMREKRQTKRSPSSDDDYYDEFHDDKGDDEDEREDDNDETDDEKKDENNEEGQGQSRGRYTPHGYRKHSSHGQYNPDHYRGHSSRGRHSPDRHRKNSSPGRYSLDRYREPSRHGQHSSDHHREHSRHYYSRRHKHEDKSFVCLPTGNWVEIERYDHQLLNFRCGSKTILIDLEPSNQEYQLMEKQMQDTKQSHAAINFSKYKIKKIQRVINGCLMRKYKRRQADIKAECGHTRQRMLFHGTHKVEELLTSGFDERYSRKGMFGYGTYFAKDSSKSNQYAFGLNGNCPTHSSRQCMICERKILICRVTLGNIYEVKEAKPNTAHPPPGFHSLRGVATPGVLKYDEYIVYRGEQAYPDYVITYTLEP